LILGTEVYSFKCIEQLSGIYSIENRIEEAINLLLIGIEKHNDTAAGFYNCIEFLYKENKMKDAYDPRIQYKLFKEFSNFYNGNIYTVEYLKTINIYKNQMYKDIVNSKNDNWKQNYKKSERVEFDLNIMYKDFFLY